MQFHRSPVVLLTLLWTLALTACGGGSGLATDDPPTALSYVTPAAVYRVCEPAAPNVAVLVGGQAQFSVEPALPSGLVLNPSTGTIGGTPLQPAAATFHTVTATNDGGQISTAISIQVQPAIPPSALIYSSPDVTYGVNVPITPNVPTVAGSVQGWQVTPGLPVGLSLNPVTGIISGTPTQVTAQAVYTVVATNCVGQSVSALVRIRVADPNSPPENLSYTNLTPVYVGCQPIVPNVPIVEGFPQSYSVVPALPAGLTLDPLSGVIAGVPTQVSDTAVYTITATNLGGTAVTTINLRVVEPDPPTDLTYAPLSPTYAIGSPGPTLTPSVDGDVVGYSVSPALPAGLTLDPLTGVISGTALGPASDLTYVVTGVDCVGQQVTANVRIEVADPSQPPTNFAYSTNPAVYRVCEDVAPNLPIVTGVVDLYTITPALPLGLQLDPTSGIIDGVPIQSTGGQSQSFDVTASNAAGQATTTIQIRIDPPDTPANLDYPFDIVVYTIGVEIDPNVPSFDGEVTQWSVIPPLPDGLTLDPVTGTISGAPTEAANTTDHTISGSNCVGDVVSATIKLTVIDPSTFVPRYLFTLNADGTVSGFTVDALTGQLTHNGFETTGVDPVDLEVAPTGLKLYVLNAGDLDPGSSTVTLYNVEQPSGRLTKNASIVELPDDAFPTDMELTADGDYLYVANPAPSSSISAFRVQGDGTLAELAGSPFPAPEADPVALAADPLGRYLLVAAGSGANARVSAVAIDPADGTLGAAQSLPLDGDAVSCAAIIATSGILTVHVGTDQAGVGRLEAFAIDGFSGTLSPLADVDLAAAPTRVRAATLENQRVVYVCTTTRVQRFVLNGAGEPLPPAPQVPYVVPSPSDIALTVDGSLAFVTLSGLDEVSSAEVIPGTSGQLEAISPADAPTDRIRTRNEPRAVALASGNQPVERVTTFVYATNGGQGSVSKFAFDPGGPGLTALDPPLSNAGTSPDGIAVHPFLDLAYVVDAFSGTTEDVLIFPINPNTGELNAPGTVDIEDAGVTGDGALTVVVEPNGRFAYVVRSGAPTSQIIRYTIVGSTFDSPTVVSAGDQARYPAIDPTGRFLYVPNQFSANVSQYSIDPATGELTSLGTVPAGAAPFAVAVDATGRFAYVANRGSNDVSTYRIDSDTGQLVSLGPAVPSGLAPTALVAGPRGRTLYVANQLSASITRFIVNLNPVDQFPDGVIGSLGTFNLPGQPRWLDLDATGERMFVTLTNNGQLLTLSIDVLAGAVLTLEDSDLSATGGGTLNVSSRDRVE